MEWILMDDPHGIIFLDRSPSYSLVLVDVRNAAEYSSIFLESSLRDSLGLLIYFMNKSDDDSLL